MQWETLSAVLAHELRNPLAGVVAHLSLLEEMIDPHDPRRISLRAIDAEVRRMEATVRALLEFGRGGRARMRPVDLSSLLEDLRARWLERAHESGIRIDCEIARGMGRGLGDPVLLERVLENLVENAVRALAGKGGVISLTARRRGSHLELSCRDTGCGIPEEHLESIFDPFFTRFARGVGLGLALARRIVEEHGGTLSVVSTLGQGSCFTLRLPARNVRAQKERQAGDGALALR